MTGKPERQLVQVDRVASLEEAVLFQQAGADLIGVALDADPRFEDARFVPDSVAIAIRDAIRTTSLVGILPDLYDSAEAVQARILRLLALRPAFLQVLQGRLPGELTTPVREAGVPIIVDGASMSDNYAAYITPGDPVSVLREQLEASRPYNAALFHVDVADGTTDPWGVLAGPSHLQQEGSLRIEHVAAATGEFPLMLNLADHAPAAVADYVAAFPKARGFFGRLGPGYGGGPATDAEAILRTLRALAKRH